MNTSTVANCLPDSQLWLFHNGLLREVETDQTADHLDLCDKCLDRFERLKRWHLLAHGTRLQDRYTVRSFLGRGGMGEVYVAHDDRFSPPREVAVKLLSVRSEAADSDSARTAKWQEQFRFEGDVLARLAGGDFVQIYDVGEWQQRLFIVMELVVGDTLADRERAILPPVEAARLIEILAEAMSKPHHLGIVHCDLKPKNVLMLDGRPKITDFGIARVAEEVGGPAAPPQVELVIGTPAYMAPEQWRGNPAEVGPAADIYALGAILYELLTGKPPYLDEVGRDRERLRLVVLDESRLPSGPDQAPRDLRAICLKCLAKRSRDRYPNAHTLAEDLRRFQAGEPVLARPVGYVGRLLHWMNRNRKAAALSSIPALLVAGLLGVGIVVTSRSVWTWTEALASTTGRTDERDGPIFQRFDGSQNPVSFSWAQASARSWIVFLVEDDPGGGADPSSRKFLRLWFENGTNKDGPSYPSNVGIRAADEKYVIVGKNGRYLKFDTRVPPQDNGDAFLRGRGQLEEIQLAIRVRDGRGTYWEYAYDHDDYIELFASRRDPGWKTQTIDLRAESWVTFPVDGNSKHAAGRPVFTKISDVVVEVGSRNQPGSPRRPGPGVGRIDIRNVRLEVQE